MSGWSGIRTHRAFTPHRFSRPCRYNHFGIQPYLLFLFRADALRIERRSMVLETIMLPLHHAPIYKNHINLFFFSKDDRNRTCINGVKARCTAIVLHPYKDLSGIRTHICGFAVRRLNHWTMRSYSRQDSNLHDTD